MNHCVVCSDGGYAPTVSEWTELTSDGRIVVFDSRNVNRVDSCVVLNGQVCSRMVLSDCSKTVKCKATCKVQSCKCKTKVYI
jgi:hypothetical protein